MSDVMSREVLKPKWDTLEKPAVTVSHRAKFADLDEGFWPIYDQVRARTMTSVERLYDLYKSVEYVVLAGIPGDIIECGVWKGGSMMLVAETLKKFAAYDRKLQLYDTFEGLPYPESENDVDLIGNHAAERWHEGWIKVPIEEVSQNMLSCEYPGEVELVPGMVEDTLRGDRVRPRYSIVRLDTDWEASTRVELEVLWPRLSVGGFCVVDDYGHWRGARIATDEFFGDKAVKMSRVDYSCRVIQKITP